MDVHTYGTYPRKRQPHHRSSVTVQVISNSAQKLGGEEIQTLQLFNCYMKQGAYKPFQLFNCYKHLLQSHIGELKYCKIRYKPLLVTFTGHQ